MTIISSDAASDVTGQKLPAVTPVLFKIFAGVGIAVTLGFATVAPFIQAIPVPFAFSFFFAAVAVLGLALAARRWALLSGLLISSFTLLIGLSGIEAYLAWRQWRPAAPPSAATAVAPVIADAFDYTHGYFNLSDPDLGYGPNPNRVTEDTRTADGKPIFHAKYTIGPGAFRLTPGNPKANETDVFFGCSFTFGEGLNDDQTVPAQYSKARGYATNVLNLGFHGYGPHDMLRALEVGKFDRYFTGHVKHVFFQSILYHLQRVKGLAPWDLDGPRYVLDKKTQKPVYTGRFSDNPSPFYSIRHPILDRSLILQRIMDDAYNYHTTQPDIDLLAGILAASARIVKEKYGADFTLLAWDYDPDYNYPMGEQIAEAAESRGIPVVRVTKLLPDDWKTNFRARFLIPVDGHPNAYTDEIFGKGLASRVH